MQEVKRSRCENQSKHTPKQTQNITTNQQQPEEQSTKSLRVPRAQYSKSSQKSRCNRAAQSIRGVAKCEGMPDHQNHHHVDRCKKVSWQAVVRTPTSPRTKAKALQAWAEAARHTNQQLGVNAFARILLQGSQTLGHRQYQEFTPGPPVHFQIFSGKPIMEGDS